MPSSSNDKSKKRRAKPQSAQRRKTTNRTNNNRNKNLRSKKRKTEYDPDAKPKAFTENKAEFKKSKKQKITYKLYKK